MKRRILLILIFTFLYVLYFSNTAIYTSFICIISTCFYSSFQFYYLQKNIICIHNKLKPFSGFDDFIEWQKIFKTLKFKS
jgi:hypothetical protein